MNAKEYYKSIKQDRAEWSALFRQCMWCGGGGGFLPLETHEIQRKSGCQNRWASRTNYLRLCSVCHAGPFATMPHAKQLKLKQEVDFEHYNLREWLMIYDPELRAPERVTQEEVDAAQLDYPVSKGGLQF